MEIEEELETSWISLNPQLTCEVALVNSQKRISTYKKGRRLYLLFRFKEPNDQDKLNPTATYVVVDDNGKVTLQGGECKLKLSADTGEPNEKLFELVEAKSTIEIFGKVSNKHKCSLLVKIPSLDIETLVPYSAVNSIKRKLSESLQNYELTDTIPNFTLGVHLKQRICIQWNKQLESIKNPQVLFELIGNDKNILQIPAVIEKTTPLYVNVTAPSLSDFRVDILDLRTCTTSITVIIDGIHIGKINYNYVLPADDRRNEYYVTGNLSTFANTVA